MKVPKKIKEEIRKCVDAYTKATFSENIVRNWLKEEGLVDEYNNADKYMIDSFIDLIVYTNAPGQFIEELENLKEWNYNRGRK